MSPLPWVAMALATRCALGPVSDPPTDSAAVKDLPVVEQRAATPRGGTLALMLTGDGGWAELDRGIASRFNAEGIDVIAFKSPAYLSTRRTPDETAGDLTRVLRYYLPRWRDARVMIVGYSRGADIAPFIVNRLPLDLRGKVSLVALLGMATAASFQFHLEDLVRDVHRPTDVPIAPELARLRGMNMLCVYGSKELDTLCRTADPTLIKPYMRAGDHHFDKDYVGIADLILGAMR